MLMSAFFTASLGGIPPTWIVTTVASTRSSP